MLGVESDMVVLQESIVEGVVWMLWSTDQVLGADLTDRQRKRLVPPPL